MLITRPISTNARACFIACQPPASIRNLSLSSTGDIGSVKNNNRIWTARPDSGGSERCFGRGPATAIRVNLRRRHGKLKTVVAATEEKTLPDILAVFGSRETYS